MDKQSQGPLYIRGGFNRVVDPSKKRGSRPYHPPKGGYTFFLLWIWQEFLMQDYQALHLLDALIYMDKLESERG